ncbi:MAG: hypothetical protein NZ653_10200, partial [Anaerolineae bacterium]|nr:hypothetical protein [Anaerolineae bacterium]
MAHAAAIFVRVLLHQCRVQSDQPEEFGHFRPGHRIGKILQVGFHRLNDLVAHPVYRVQGVHRSLENHRNPSPAVLTHLLLAERH